MSGKIVATIYFYLISIGAIVLMVIGVFDIVNLFVNSTQYSEYPLRYNAISNCEYVNNGNYGGPMPMTNVKVMPQALTDATPSAEDIQKAQEQCLKNDEADRKLHQVEDIKNALTFPLVGIVLFLIHFPMARKQSSK